MYAFILSDRLGMFLDMIRYVRLGKFLDMTRYVRLGKFLDMTRRYVP